jgi:phage tail sheath protein FI
MPVAVSYPGVYIQEISSGVRTITGVATSITAFIGRALRGPSDEPVSINSYADFERIFGGLWADSTLGYAVRDFYLNGGSQAIIVRLFHPKFASDVDRAKAQQAAKDTAAAAVGADGNAAAAAAKTKADTYAADPEKSAAKAVADAAKQAADAGGNPADVKKAADAAADAAAPIAKAALKDVKGLDLEAKYEGKWGNSLRARIDDDVTGPDAANLFNLSVRDGTTGQIEIFRNVSVVPGHVRQVDKVLENESLLVTMTNALPAAKPGKHDDPAPHKKLWDDNGTSSKVTDVATDGSYLDDGDFTGAGKEAAKQGLYALQDADLFNILCIPPYPASGDVTPALVSSAAAYCELRRAMLLVDPPTAWNNKDKAKSDVGNVGTNSKNAAFFFPRLRQPDPQRGGQVGDFVPCGAVAGVFARTDTTRGVWKAPAGLDATLVGVPELSVSLTDMENGELNPLGINCLRTMPPAGRIVWGSRTLQGDDRLTSEWKYIPVRRTALFLEETLFRALKWVVFEPNDEPLWAQIRLNVGAFMQGLFRQGAFQGKTPQAAYFVKCDKETTTQNDINLGIVNIVVGFAPLKPAEFVVISIQQMAGQIQT